MAKTIGMEKEESGERRTRLNKKTNLLEMENYHYEVQEIPDPNLLREFFEYTEIPRSDSTSGPALTACLRR